MQKFDTLIPLAEQEIDKLIARQPARDGDGKTSSSPPKPPAYARRRRRLLKRRKTSRQMQLEMDI